MITVVAKLKFQAGKESEAEKALRDMIDYVRKSEPGTLSYALNRSRRNPAELLMVERYADKSALDTHSGSERMQALFATIGPLLDGQPSIEMYEELDGKH